MKDSSEDTGVILALIDRFNKQRLPRMLELKKRVDGGETITETDVRFLEEVFESANSALPMADKHPDLQPLASRAISLFKEITQKALENEKQS